jgi:hypothetical protein
MKMASYHLLFKLLCIGVVLYSCTPKTARKFDQAPETLPVESTDSLVSVGIVIVKICVDWKGDVISTALNEAQSNTRDTALINKAIRAAKTYKFEERQGSPVQCGKITFNFKAKDKQ